MLEVAKGSTCTNDEVYQFLSHFVIIEFGFLREGEKDPAEAINRIRDCLSPDEASKAPLVWSQLVQLARASSGRSGQFNRARLVRLISQNTRLIGANSLRGDLNTISALAKGYAALIPDDVGGTKLDRSSLVDKLSSKLKKVRLVQITGLPGSGKSVLVRSEVQRSLEIGPTLFLKAEQLEGTGWISYAASQGLSGVSLETLLVEVGASGTPILFIDAIDRIEKSQQPIVLDLFRVITQSKLLDNWKIVVSLRDTGIEVLRNWLENFLSQETIETLPVNHLNDDEAEILAKAKPHLRSLLFGVQQVQEIVRRPFFAKILDQGYRGDARTTKFVPGSEIDLIEHWWLRGGYDADGKNVLLRQRVLLELARIRSRELSKPIRISQLGSVDQIDGLIADGILQQVR
ncbi:hypothetical protein [Marinagarivorans cellulosilyticus]|uniref:hypothetical protein n=1 Tax=Marinagarivorans cellulosilyticus TaxID=2721545 RepID=UPI001F306D8A|nr:hypothetical protein [Marinagarivorans cellulosilyticus]